MLYLGTSPREPGVAELLNRRRLGLMCQPESNPPRVGWIWAADNGCFKETWKESGWRSWLERSHPRSGCLFATVPDVVGDAEATMARFNEYVGVVRGARYPVAYVAQDGSEAISPPWDGLDCLFVGGTTEWKRSAAAFELAAEARERGKWVHVGRVNTWRRFDAWASHADSCDGTFLAWGPRANLPRLMRWIDRHDRQLRLEVA